MGSIREHRGTAFAILALVLVAFASDARAAEPNADLRLPQNTNVYQPGNLAQSACGSEPCDPAVVATAPRCPWYGRVEGLLLRRDVRGNSEAAALGPLLTGASAPNGVLFTGDLDQPFGGGGKVLLGHTFGDSPFQVELSYFTVSAFEGEASVRDTTDNGLGTTGYLFSPFTNFGSPTAVQGVDYNNLVTIRDYSTLQNGEVNVVRLLPGVPGRLTSSFLIGVRCVDIDEQFNYYSESAVPLATGARNAVDTRTRNFLCGPQIGALAQIFVEDAWWIDFTIKGAICNNSASQDTTYIHSEGTDVSYNHERSRNVTSYLGELDLAVVWRCRPNFTTRIGYQATWIEGLALAQENYNQDLGYLTNGPAWLDHNGRVVYHGVHAGVELAW